MPWSNKGGGGWQSGGGGDGGGPWGQRPSGGGGGGGGRQNPPDIEDLLKKGQDKLKDIIPGGGAGGSGPSNKFIWILALVALAGVWIMNAVYTVGPDEEGVVLRLGKYHRTTPPGLHFIMWPVETVETMRVRAVNQTNLGGAGNSTEGLMLAGDQNIVDIHFSVQWRISSTSETSIARTMSTI